MIDKANSSRTESKGILEQLKAARARVKTISAEKETLFQQVQALNANRQAHQKSLQEQRKSLQFETVQEVETKVRELENRISHGQCADLKEEKKVMMEIKTLNASKLMIAQYNAQRSSVVDDSEQRADIERKRAEVNGRLDAAKKEADGLDKQLKDAGSKLQADNPINLDDLRKEQRELYNKLKAHKAEIRKVISTHIRELECCQVQCCDCTPVRR